ncbi:TonB-dependent siderophore receptor [Egbenema bharatensis]|uniref:TonB-dependent siderophore receptor n=1 Tax=Egbenema bharatensis TaxID=3463334 RepID=UPI003A8434DA
MVKQLRRWGWVGGIVSLVIVQSAWAQEVGNEADEIVSAISTLDELEQPATTVEAWMSQIQDSSIAQTAVQITGVRVESVATGIEIRLETTGDLGIPATSIVGNAFIAEISNAVLALPEGEEFQQANPIAGIALVAVTNLPNNRVRVAITGVDAPPESVLNSSRPGLVFSITPGTEAVATDEDAIQVIVTGEQEDGYAPSNATTATRTDTPLREIPQSIQVIPQQVLEDQRVIRLQDATRNVSGVQSGDSFGGSRDEFIIRGFRQFNTFRDGFRDSRNLFRDTANIERIEVLKGPASVLFGTLEPGGVINIITEQPLAEPFYSFELQAGSFGFIRPEIDLSGPVSPELDVFYRLNLAYEHSDGFRDFDQDIDRIFVAPVLAIELSDRTRLNLEFDYLRDERPFDRGVVAIGDGVADIPVERILGEPDDFRRTEAWSAGYRFEHDFNEDWTVRNAFRFQRADTFDNRIDPDTLNEETGELTRFYSSNDDLREVYELQTNIVGNFNTGSVEHTLLFGVDWSRQIDDGFNQSPKDFVAAPINIFDPVYGRVEDRDITEVRFRDSQRRTESWGLYIQDQIDILDNLHFLIGGRFDFVDQLNINRLSGGDRSSQSDEAFSPRVGLVYRPIEPLSLYASYSRSFSPNSGEQVDGTLLEPERGTQYEVGIRGEVLDGRLTANLAAFHLTKSNVATTDPENPDFSIAVGEQRSQGIELDVIGRILPGWNLIASYAYIDAEVTEDNFIEEGVSLPNVPYHSASLWTTYEIQQGDLQGLGFGLGLFFVGDRAGDLDNSYELPSFLRTDAALYYRRDNWRAAVNVQNLFGVDYYTGVEFGRTSIAVGAPLTVIGSVSVEF